MKNDTPFLLVRARPRADSEQRFAEWFRNVHLRDARQIPGIAQVEAFHTPGGARLAFLTFANTESVQAALSSPQAAYARGTWEQWAGHLEELLVEIWAPLYPLPIYQSTS